MNNVAGVELRRIQSLSFFLGISVDSDFGVAILLKAESRVGPRLWGLICG